MSADDKEWQKLSFAQRMGVEPLPTALKPTELTAGLRSALWASLYHYIATSVGSSEYLKEPWEDILYRKHVYFDQQMAHEFQTHAYTQYKLLSAFFKNGTFDRVYGCLEYILRDPECPEGFKESLQEVLRDNLAPYAITEWGGIMPIASAEQGLMLEHALEQLRKTPLAGASEHLKQSIAFLNKGQWAKSIAESIHAVESVARKIEPSANRLDPALKKLAPKAGIHPAMQKAFGLLYGFTSDEQGIRHALIDKDSASVGRDDAIFMLTACAAFSSYLANKAADAGLL